MNDAPALNVELLQILIGVIGHKKNRFNMSDWYTCIAGYASRDGRRAKRFQCARDLWTIITKPWPLHPIPISVIAKANLGLTGREASLLFAAANWPSKRLRGEDIRTAAIRNIEWLLRDRASFARGMAIEEPVAAGQTIGVDPWYPALVPSTIPSHESELV